MSEKRRKKKTARVRKRPADQIVVASTVDRHDQWPALTGLRGLAAFAVLCFHAFGAAGQPATMAQPFKWLLLMGWSGVDVFFTLSAFLLTVPFVLSNVSNGVKPNLGSYAMRRLFRILPAYYVQIAIMLALGALGVTGQWAWTSPAWPTLLAHVTFYLNALPIISPKLSPWWTLPVEMVFYLLLPLFALCLRPGRWWWLLVAIAASLGYRYWLTHIGLDHMQLIAWVDQLPGRLHQFLIGMLAAYAFVRLKMRENLPRANIADVLALSATVLFLLLPALGYLVGDRAYQGGPVGDPLQMCWHLFASLLIAVLLLALVAGAPRMQRVFSWAPLRGLGLISYSLYLWHYPVQLWLRAELGGFGAIRADFWPFFFYSVLISVLVAFASWWMIERPAQSWGRRVKLVA